MNSFLAKISLYRFLDDFILVYPVYTLMFEDAGVSKSGISLLFIIWIIISLVFEVPSGVLADRYNRKWILFIAQPIRLLGYVCWLCAGSSFWLYALGFALWGIKGALVSGTFESYVYDELAAENRQKEYEKVLGRLKFWYHLALAGSMAGAVLVDYLGSYTVVLVASIISVACSALIIFTFPQPSKVRSTSEVNVFPILGKAIREIRQNTSLFSILSFTVVVTAVYGTLDEYWGLYFRDIGWRISAIGMIALLGFSLQAIASFLAPRVHVSRQVERGVIYLTFMYTGLLVSGLLLNMRWSVILIVLANVVATIATVKLENEMQQRIQADERATITSLQKFFMGTLAMGFTGLIGCITHYASLQAGLIAVSLFAGLAGLATLIQKHPQAN